MSLGEKIVELRKKRGLSQEDLAITLGVSRQAVSKWETGDSTPDTDKIVLLAEYFSVTTDWLLRDIQPPEATASTDAHMSAEQAQAGAPLLLSMTLGASACGLALLLYGDLYASSYIPAAIGVLIQICAIAFSTGFGLFMKNSISSETGSHFIRTFWRCNIWIVALLPVLMLCSMLTSLLPMQSLAEKLWLALPQPLWTLGRLLFFAGIPILLYLAVCLFVAFRLCRTHKTDSNNA